MPTYEYRCPAGHDFEHFVPRMSDATSTMPCPVCGAVAERRISAGGGLLFKGSGFYITDYGKDGKKDQRANPGKAAMGSEGKPGSAGGEGSAKGDAKPDAAAKTDTAAKPPSPSTPPPKSGGKE